MLNFFLKMWQLFLLCYYWTGGNHPQRTFLLRVNPTSQHCNKITRQAKESYLFRILLPAKSFSVEHTTAPHMVNSLWTWIFCLDELFKVTFQTYIGQWAYKKMLSIFNQKCKVKPQDNNFHC